jgi:hypothetical protein
MPPAMPNILQDGLEENGLLILKGLSSLSLCQGCQKILLKQTAYWADLSFELKQF